MKVYYRISGSQKKKEGQFGDWKSCFENFFNQFVGHTIEIIADNITDEIREFFSKTPYTINLTSLGNSGSFQYALNLACQNNDQEIIYFVEDDYYHLGGSPEAIEEGLQIADYVSLYDHADKYQPPYTNEWGGEPTRVLLTPSTHWKQTFSTCMTFASTVKTLREDRQHIERYLDQPVPRDWEMFMELKNKGRKLITPIPGFATHCIKQYQSPLISWEKLCGK